MEKMGAVHLIYPAGNSISCPEAIGRNLKKALEKKYPVVTHDWNKVGVIVPNDGDILIGHPHPNPLTVFNLSSRYNKWKRVIALAPYNHGQPEQLAYLNSILPRCHQYLAITGNYWMHDLSNSVFSHWKPKMVHVDLAVSPIDFPRIKRCFNPLGKRRFLYIGNCGWTKNTEYLSEIAHRMESGAIGWIGPGKHIPGTIKHGKQDFRSAQAQQLVAEHDFLVTVSRSDANPATILEAMSWGLIPVCTPQSGYVGFSGIPNIPLDNPQEAAGMLGRLNYMPEEHLERMRQNNDQLLQTHFNWERFTNQVIESIESSVHQNLEVQDLIKRIQITKYEITSAYFPLRPRQIVNFAKSNLSNFLKKSKI